MAVVDHSLTYRVLSPRNLPHRLRLRAISAIVWSLDLPERPTFADFGCSNDFVSEHVRRLIEARETYGFDHQDGHFEVGRSLYPDIHFDHFDLNGTSGAPTKCDLVTCFETLENVGRLDRALDNLLSAVVPGGALVISVPIEIGTVGLAKFALKLAYGYDLSELPPRPDLRQAYTRALMSGARMSQFRDRRSGWATHFGFDYRDLDETLTRHRLKFNASNRGLTRFYLIGPKGSAEAR